MAIQFARIEILGRTNGGNACCKGAYNSRGVIRDFRTNKLYDFSNQGDNVHHEILLPEHVDIRFKNASELMNEIERVERKSNSQLLKDVVIALPDNVELNLDDRIKITKQIIDEMRWVDEGLGVQIDIHKPHDGKNNWHAHLLVTTRRFLSHGKSLGAKARDLNPAFKSSGDGSFIVPEEDIIHEKAKRIINQYFADLNLDLRVDAISSVPGEHIGPNRMRSIFSEGAERNEVKKKLDIELLDSSDELLTRVVSKASIFSERDLYNVVKIIEDPFKQKKLIDGALKSHDVIELLYENGIQTGFFTTKQVRSEEQKILRLASLINNKGNIMADIAPDKILHLIEQVSGDCDIEQEKALLSLLACKGGVRSLQGLAGSGKSFVLAKLGVLAKNLNINLIALAPTNKAVNVLKNQGFQETNTIKGFLYKLRHLKADLLSKSIILVDEAGMVANEDFAELFRVAAQRGCNVILSGDQRQLSSVARGGMFSIFAEHFELATLLRIKRQDEHWGRQVAQAFSEGDVKFGLGVLARHEKLFHLNTKEESMHAIINNWGRSRFDLKDRIIIAIKNDDVDLLNELARSYLKKRGDLSSQEYLLRGKKYAQGERILFTQNNKELGITNGDFGVIHSISQNQIEVLLDSKAFVSFSPLVFNQFKHGYASTIYKAQGASIYDVYILHDGFGSMKNSYVSMSRHIKDVKFFFNKDTCKSIFQLINQLKQDREYGSSLSFTTKAELVMRQKHANRGRIASIVHNIFNFAKDKIEQHFDKNIVDEQYYNFNSNTKYNFNININLGSDAEKFQEIITDDQVTARKEFNIKNKNVALESSTLKKTKLIHENTISIVSFKERFYAKVAGQLKQKMDFELETEILRRDARLGVERIVEHFMAEPNKSLSTRDIVRYGQRGSFVVKISGQEAGHWYDFSKGRGGDIFDFVMDQQSCDFKGAANFLKDFVGVPQHFIPNIHFANSNFAKDKFDNFFKSEQAVSKKATKVLDVQKLYARAKYIGEKSISKKYLASRGITCDLSLDIKTTTMYEQSLQKSMPALIVFARSKDGIITGCQRLVLDPDSAKKAKVDMPKKSLGTIAGSFVNINHSRLNPNITIIAEGVETALSLKQAGCEANIICSLGISNIKNYEPSIGERIIIAADNDGPDAISNITIEQAASHLSNFGAVRIVRPEIVGDFNDMLKEQDQSAVAIKKLFEPVLVEFAIKSLDEFFADQHVDYLKGQEKQQIAKIKEYNLNENKILQAFLKGEKDGKIVLNETSESLNKALKSFVNNQHLTKCLKTWSKDINIEKQLVQKIVSIGENSQSNKNIADKKPDHHEILKNIVSEVLDNHVQSRLEVTHQAKTNGKSLDEIIKISQNEQLFLKNIGKDLQDIGIELAISCSRSYAAIGFAQNPALYDLAVSSCSDALKRGAIEEREAKNIWQNNFNVDSIFRTFSSKIQLHQIESQLMILAQNKQAAKGVIDSFEAFKAEVYFKAESYESLKDKDESCPMILELKSAYNAKASPDMAKLVDSLNHLQQNNIWPNAELIVHLKSQKNVKDFTRITIHACQNHHFEQVCKNIDKIFDEGSLKARDKEFVCPLEYIKHEIKSPAHAYACPQKLGAKLAQVRVHIQELELAETHELDTHRP